MHPLNNEIESYIRYDIITGGINLRRAVRSSTVNCCELIVTNRNWFMPDTGLIIISQSWMVL